jgi:hypothetical protein
MSGTLSEVPPPESPEENRRFRVELSINISEVADDLGLHQQPARPHARDHLIEQTLPIADVVEDEGGENQVVLLRHAVSAKPTLDVMQKVSDLLSRHGGAGQFGGEEAGHVLGDVEAVEPVVGRPVFLERLGDGQDEGAGACADVEDVKGLIDVRREVSYEGPPQRLECGYVVTDGAAEAASGLPLWYMFSSPTRSRTSR